ncbi:MAG: arginase [Chloroflexi bacterium]|nr:arginase [Chloroflexota bacterium]
MTQQHTVALIGAPSSVGGLPVGSDIGPARLREAGLVARLRQVGLEVSDFGDVPVPRHHLRGGYRSRFANTESVARWVAKYAWRAIAQDMVPLVLGGDHSVAMGSIAAAAQSVPGLGVVWVDAHPDFNTPETSPTGNPHGMALAVAAGLGPLPLVRLMGYTPMVHPERIVILGARSIDAGELDNLRRAGVQVYNSEYLHDHGVRETVGEALAHLADAQVRAVHLSIDLDVLDPAHWPGVSTPADDGLTASELVALVDAVSQMAPISSMDLAELTPAEDVEGATTEAAIQVAEHALASLVRQAIDSPGRGSPVGASAA